jgi:hypothetical protein
VTGLTAATTYHFRAYELNDTIDERYNTDTATGDPNNQTTLPNTPRPGAPTATAATSITQTGFSANWNAVSGAMVYKLDVATDSGFTSYVSGYQNKDVGGMTTSSVTGVSAGTTCYYRVRAHNTGGTSDNSNTVTATTLTLPTKVDLTGPSSVNVGAVSTTFILTSQDGSGNTTNVTQDTVFSLSSNSSGTATFYSDGSGGTAITQVTIAAGNNQTTFCYKDSKSGNPTVTAAWKNGGSDLGNGSHDLRVIAGYIYVSKTGICGGKTPCYTTIQEAVDAAGTNYAIRIAGGTYQETVILGELKDLILQGGWNATFTTQTVNTTFMNPPVIKQGSLALQMITLFSNFMYISLDGTCGGMTPCFTSIQDAVDGAASEATIRIAERTYTEGIVLDAPKDLIFQGGWDTLFTTQKPSTTFIKAPVVKQGSIKLQMLSIR